MPKSQGCSRHVGWAFFVPAQTYAVVLMPTAWFIFIFWLILWRIVGWKNAPTKWEALILGLLVGLAATAIATILFLIPLLVSAILIKPAISTHSQFRTRMGALVLLFLGAAAGTSPCWVHNCLIAHDRVFLSAHSGINFWIGNNPGREWLSAFSARSPRRPGCDVTGFYRCGRIRRRAPAQTWRGFALLVRESA